MSMAEFYIDNCLDPSDPYHMDQFFRQNGDYDDLPEQRRAAKAFVLNESELNYMAETRGWDILDASSSDAPMASYGKDGVRLNFWLTTGTVGSYLDHPKQGKTQLFRREIGMSEASEIFNNPRLHTGSGYHTKEQAKNLPVKRNQKHKHQSSSTETARTCRSCGRTKSTAEFSKNQRRKGSSAKCKTCVG